MGQSEDLNVGPGGIGALLSMIIKTSMHRHATHKHTHSENTHRPISLTHTSQPCAFTHKNDEIGYDWLCPLVNPGGTGLPPFLSFSNNVGLT